MSAANIAKLRGAAEHGSRPTQKDIVAMVGSFSLVPDHGRGPRIYFTLDIGYKTGVIPSRVGQLRITDGALIPQGRFGDTSTSRSPSGARR